MNEEKTTTKNRVLAEGHKQSQNFWESDLILRHLVHRDISATHLVDYLDDKLEQLGKKTAQEMNKWSLDADKQVPKIVRRDFYGEDIDKIEFHPAYEAMKKVAVDAGMFTMKWNPTLRQRFAGERNRMSFSTGLLYAMTELSLYCPLCMTDGVAVLLDKYAEDKDKERLLPRIATDDVDNLYTGAMFLTEKAGGSDVGANLVEAKKVAGNHYYLNGEKWFCSNASAEIIFALARTDSTIKGTKGLGIFLVEPRMANGDKNPMHLVRLKDKLGTRSMASAEYVFENTRAKLVGEEQTGFKIMTDMINLSRLYNSVAAVGGLRRALVEAYQFLKYRFTFGKNALQHALIRTKLEELAAMTHANYYMTWRAITALDRAENGNDKEAELLRFLTPLLKKGTAEDAVYIVRESMELMGGLGYIEDGVMPKIMRDVMVLPIWEGAGNIMTLDALRASVKSEGMNVLLEEFRQNIQDSRDLYPNAAEVLTSIFSQNITLFRDLPKQDREVIEATAKPLFEQLTRWYQVSLLMKNTSKTSEKWLRPAVNYWIKRLTKKGLSFEQPLSVEMVENMMAWKF